ncbi:MAG TPA: DNA/RNA nuclease SfsA [Rhodospirillales bacterium]|nr:DNA/RNA nuclease SfsA [Rhodospirillales bacterium]
MKFTDPLIGGRLIKRYKRFMADVELESGETVTAHCANSGSMMGLKEPGSEVWLSPAHNPKRKLRYTWEMIRVDGNLVGVNTSRPNGLVEEAVRNGTIRELAGYGAIRREVKYGRNSRIDLLLDGARLSTCYVEVKSVTLKRGGAVQFPDAVTVRGAKHLVELSEMAAQGHRAVMVYLVQRQDGAGFSIAKDIDPVYAETLSKAKKAGVEIVCYECNMSLEEIRVTKSVPLESV